MKSPCTRQLVGVSTSILVADQATLLAPRDGRGGGAYLPLPGLGRRGYMGLPGKVPGKK